jgi:uncharacterized membrane protein YfcA
MDPVQIGLAVVCGLLVGFTLGLIGGGGSIMATPLLLYVVGLPPHLAIGTGALAVSVNSFVNFGGHARAGNVHWRSAILFAVIGVAGATIGSSLGKTFDGQKLLFLFAILMVVVGVLMLRRGSRSQPTRVAPTKRLTGYAIAKIAAAALLVGTLSGFFGIGGGFLIVPGLLFSTGMPMIFAVGSSLLAVGSFGLTTAVNYAISGLVDWPVAAEYIAGGIIGGWIGMRLSIRLAPRKAALNRVFAGFVFVVAAYMLYRNFGAISGS